MKNNINSVVIKFGGTSVSRNDRIQTICDIVVREKSRNPIVVVSALSGVTDLLLSLSHKNKNELTVVLRDIKKIHMRLVNSIWKDKKNRSDIESYIDEKMLELLHIIKNNIISKKALDNIVSFGEIMSSYIVSKALQSRSISSRQIIASDLIITDSHFGSAEFLVEPTKRKIIEVLLPLITKGIVPVVTGFIGANQEGEITILGRGGSDYTASIIGFCLNSKEIQIWTDVNGIYTTDPRLVKKAWCIPIMSYKEASEMAFFGAKILHPRTIRPAIKAKIPVRVLNTLNPEHPGTLIVEKSDKKNSIKAISFKRNITLVNMYATEMLLSKGFLMRIFGIFSKNNISVDLVSVSEVSISVTLDNIENIDTAIKELETFTKVTLSKNNATISLIEEGIVNSSVTISNVFNLLNKKNILVKMVSLGATNINISLVIESDQLDKVVIALHNNLFKNFI